MKKNWTLWIALLSLCLGGFAPIVAAEARFRTWSDSSGKFQIKAKLVSVAGDTITLLKEDGTEIELPLSKLSEADQAAAIQGNKELQMPTAPKQETPVEIAKRRAAERKKGSPPAGFGNSAAGRGSSGSDAAEELNLERVNAPISTAPQVLLPVPDPAAWRLAIPAPPKNAEFSKTPRMATIPPRQFFEKLESIIVNPRQQKAVLGYFNQSPGPKDVLGQSRVEFVELANGRSVSGSSLPGHFRPLALSDDGKMLLMHRFAAGWGKGNDHTCEIWKMDGAKFVTRLSWMPFQGEAHGGEITWGEFIGTEKLVLSSKIGTIGVWKVKGLEPLFQIVTADGVIPALSPDQKLLAFSGVERLDFLEIEKREVVASMTLPKDLHSPSLAFSPTGKQIAGVSHGHVMMWDSSTGKLLGRTDTAYVFFSAKIDVPSDDHVLVGTQFLFNAPETAQIWKYTGHEGLCSVAGWTFLVVNQVASGADSKRPGLLLTMKIPQAGIKEYKLRAENDPSFYVLREGTVVKLDLNGLPDPAGRARVAAEMTKQLERNKCKIGDDGTITLVPTLTGPVVKEISYQNAGDYKFQELTYGIKFVHNGIAAWEHSGNNVPSFVQQGPDETFQGALKRYEVPDYAWFSRIELPKFLQRPGAAVIGVIQPQSGFGYGQTKLTNVGVR